MFISKEEVSEKFGIWIEGYVLQTAQMMIEAFIGRNESDVLDSSDRQILGKAVGFQAVYINNQHQDILEQVGVMSMDIGSTSYSFDVELFAPYMSPFAVRACRNLSWMGTRSVKVGTTLGRAVDGSTPYTDWRRE